MLWHRIDRVQILTIVQLEPFHRPAVGDGQFRERLARHRNASHDVGMKTEFADDLLKLRDDVRSGRRCFDCFDKIQRTASPIWF